MSNRSVVLFFMLFVAISMVAQTAIVIPPKKDNSGITQVYQKKRQQVVAKQQSSPRTSATPSTKVQGICVSQIVDLGLSVKWAGWNLGATSTEQKGGYYGWADPQGVNRSKDMNQYPSATPPGSISGTQYDPARKLWGSNWRMPNAYELLELYNECRWEWIVFKGVCGAKITGPNSNSIFLPAAGYREGYDYGSQNEECNYWAGSLDPTDTTGAFCVAVEKEGNSIDREFYPEDRHLGLSIRPVYDSGMPMVDLSPEEFQQMGMAGTEKTLASFKITSISSFQNNKWTDWDDRFTGKFIVNEFTDSGNKTIWIYEKNNTKPVICYLVGEWGKNESDGNGGTINKMICLAMSPDGTNQKVTCKFAISSNGFAQFICPINGVTYSFALSE